MTAIPIPPAALEAMMHCMPIMSEEEARAGAEALLNNWPGMVCFQPPDTIGMPRIILPLTENTNAEG